MLYCLKKTLLLFRKNALNWLNVIVKTFYNVTKDFYFYLNVASKNPEKQDHGFHKNIKQVLIIRFFSWAANQHIEMISEGSCDTEDWRNDAENSALSSQE